MDEEGTEGELSKKRMGPEKVVVTGGAGFIGSHLSDELVSRGYHVIIIDDLSTGRRENIDSLAGQNRPEIILGSISDIDLLQKAFQGVSYVFHTAALARVPQSVADPYTTNEINVNGTLNVMRAAKENGVRKVIYSSSAAVYGETPVLPQREETPPDPLSPYALTKLVGEYYCSLFSQLYNLATISLRYFNVFGSRQDPLSPYANVIPLFIGRIAQGLPPVIYDDGEQSRDFVYVDDVVQANLLGMREGVEGVYNIGSGISATINELAETILSIMRKDLKPVHADPRPGDPRHALADITEASRFGYKPKFSLAEGLEAIIPFYSALANQDRN